MNFKETGREVIQVDPSTKLLTYVWSASEKPKAVFLAIHGGLAHAGDWCTPALYFMKKNVTTYAPDMRWHGTYPQYNPGGKVFFHIDSYDEYVSDISVVYNWIVKKHPGVPVFIIAHSNGSLIALKYGLSKAVSADIKGFIISSPWLKNRVEFPAIVVALSKVLSNIAPKLAVKPDDLSDKLTHDRDITARHHADEAAGLRGTHASMRLGAESMKTQAWVVKNMGEWKQFPIFCVVAGQDHLADPEVSEESLHRVPSELLEYHRYESNFHENFNETNREEIYELAAAWVNKVLGAKTAARPSSKGTVKAEAKSSAKEKTGAAKKKGKPALKKKK